MIAALDIETIPNPSTFDSIPEPECTDKRIKDPVKIAAHIDAKRQKLRDDAALDPLTGRVCAIAYVGMIDGKDAEHVDVIDAATDEAETAIIQAAMTMLGKPESRIVTFNGIGFDLPYIYKRGMILGIDPANFDAPALNAWTKRYNADRHYDIARLWYGWGAPQKGDNLAKLCNMILHDHREDIPYDQVPDLILTTEGRKLVADGCLNHTRLTWRLFERMNGTMFV